VLVSPCSGVAAGAADWFDKAIINTRLYMLHLLHSVKNKNPSAASNR